MTDKPLHPGAPAWAPETLLVAALRDEAHRFAVSFHRGQRRRLTLRSALASIPGIGLGRQRQLLRHFGSIKRVREASVDDLASVPGMTRPAAEAVFAHWAKQPVAETVSRDAPVTTENEAGKQAEELAIDDAFAAVEADQVPLTPDVTQEDNKQEI